MLLRSAGEELMKCPKCGKSVLAIMRDWGTHRRMATLEIHHHEDAKRWDHGARTRLCKVRMTFERSQRLMEALR